MRLKNNSQNTIHKAQAVRLFSYLLILAISGCGYTSRSMIASKYRTIYITPFVNRIDLTKETDTGYKYKIYKPLLETEITKKLVNKYLFDGNLKPKDEAQADVILKGELIDFRRDPVKYTDNDTVEEYRVNVVVNVSLWENHTEKVIWQENGFTSETDYYTSGPQAKSDDAAVNDSVADLVRRIVERTVEQW